MLIGVYIQLEREQEILFNYLHYLANNKILKESIKWFLAATGVVV